MINEDIIAKTEELVASSSLEDALEYLRGRTLKNDDIQKSISLLLSRKKHNDKQTHLGLITQNESNVEATRISYALLNIIYEHRRNNSRVTDVDLLSERLRTAKEEEEFERQATHFMSSTGGIQAVMEVVNDLFVQLPISLDDFSEKANLRKAYLQDSQYESTRIINFEGKVSILITWEIKSRYSLDGAMMAFRLCDKPMVFHGSFAHFGFEEPKLLKIITFLPTVNKNMEVGWSTNEYMFLSNEEVINKCFELIVEHLEQ